MLVEEEAIGVMCWAPEQYNCALLEMKSKLNKGRDWVALNQISV